MFEKNGLSKQLFPFYYVTLHYFANVFVLIKLVTDGKSVISCKRGHQSVIKEYIGGGSKILKKEWYRFWTALKNYWMSGFFNCLDLPLRSQIWDTSILSWHKSPPLKSFLFSIGENSTTECLTEERLPEVILCAIRLGSEINKVSVRNASAHKFF